MDSNTRPKWTPGEPIPGLPYVSPYWLKTSDWKKLKPELLAEIKQHLDASEPTRKETIQDWLKFGPDTQDEKLLELRREWKVLHSYEKYLRWRRDPSETETEFLLRAHHDIDHRYLQERLELQAEGILLEDDQKPASQDVGQKDGDNGIMMIGVWLLGVIIGMWISTLVEF